MTDVNETALSVRPDSVGPANSTSTVLETGRVAKSGPGTLYGFSGYNSKGSAQFILVFDCTGAPGAVQTAAIVIPAAAAAGFSYQANIYGRKFQSGIFITNSSTAPTFTVGSADCTFDVQYT